MHFLNSTVLTVIFSFSTSFAHAVEKNKKVRVPANSSWLECTGHSASAGKLEIAVGNHGDYFKIEGLAAKAIGDQPDFNNMGKKDITIKVESNSGDFSITLTKAIDTVTQEETRGDSSAFNFKILDSKGKVKGFGACSSYNF